MNVKKFRVWLLLMIMFSAIGTMRSPAMEQVVLPVSDHGVTVEFQADIPDGFEEDIELYLNGSPYYMSSASGYHIKVELELGEYEVRVLSYSDLSDRYTFSVPETLDTETDRNITVRVTDTWEGREEGESHAFGEEDHEGWESFEPEMIDLSGGESYGTILITSEPYGAVRSASYCLVGEGKVHEIPLKNEYAGCVSVRLPVGTYYESGTIQVELAENAIAPEKISYLWQHEDKPGVWGNYYYVEEGKTIRISDLIILMAVDGDMAELNSGALFSRKMVENREYLMESHYQEELESAFPESYAEGQAESIASAEDITEFSVKNLTEVLVAVLGVVTALAAGFFIFWYRRREE